MRPLLYLSLLCFVTISPALAVPRQAVEAVEVKKDIPYAGTNNPRQAVDLFLPKKRATDKPLPVVVFIHGGGWRKGDRGAGAGHLIPFVAEGNYAGVSVGYRLTDEAPFPAQIYDCKAAIRWIHANAKQYNLDASRIGIWGSSAGGHLVSLLGTSGDVKELEGDLGPSPKESSRVACVVNYYGPEDFVTFNDTKNNAASAIEGLLGGSAEAKPAVAKAASPITYVSADDPPFLNAHGVEDATVPFNQAEKIDAALRKAGVSSILVKVEGAGHSFVSPAAEALVKQFFDLHLRGIPANLKSCSVPGSSRKEPSNQPPASPK